MHHELERAFDLTGRVAVITGAAGGIGRQAAITFAQAGAHLVLADRDLTGIEHTASRAADARPGIESLGVALDAASKDSLDNLAASAVERFGRIDIWANVAGVLQRGLIIDTTTEQFDAVMDVNLGGVFWARPLQRESCATARGAQSSTFHRQLPTLQRLTSLYTGPARLPSCTSPRRSQRRSGSGRSARMPLLRALSRQA